MHIHWPKANFLTSNWHKLDCTSSKKQCALMELLSILDTKILMQPAIGYVWNENFMCMVFASPFQCKINVQSLKHHQLYLLVGELRWHLGIIMQVWIRHCTRITVKRTTLIWQAEFRSLEDLTTWAKPLWSMMQHVFPGWCLDVPWKFNNPSIQETHWLLGTRCLNQIWSNHIDAAENTGKHEKSNAAFQETKD